MSRYVVHLTPANCPGSPAFLPDATFAQQFCRPDVICIAAFAQAKTQELVGFVAIWPLKRGTYELTRLCTAPAYRHKGLGQRLLAASKAAARQQGAKWLHIGVINENRPLKQWYAAQGFRETTQKVIADLPFTVCEMTCRL
ncbi:MAG: GNAT family N-acetyltransferase [Oscillospiraceae bacterium]|nr:GNAT family N-acetyltransferase [Oscillospiraceae bacterium]